MGVPDTTTFTLQNVVDEIDNDDNLVGCFNDAIASYFDSNYGPGDESNLLQFRNYGSQNALTSFSSGSGQSDTKFICTQSVNTTKYHDGSGNNPATGDIVYENATGTTTTGNGYYTIQNGASPPATIGYYRITGGSGVVASVGICSP